MENYLDINKFLDESSESMMKKIQAILGLSTLQKKADAGNV